MNRLEVDSKFNPAVKIKDLGEEKSQAAAQEKQPISSHDTIVRETHDMPLDDLQSHDSESQDLPWYAQEVSEEEEEEEEEKEDDEIDEEEVGSGFALFENMAAAEKPTPQGFDYQHIVV